MTTCTGFIEPLNLECWLINIFAGSIEIFIFFAFIVLSGLAARFRMPNLVMFVLMGLFGILMSTYFRGIFVLIVLIGGMISFWSISNIIKR